MKKQTLIIVSLFVLSAFISCSKEKIETPESNSPEEFATARRPGSSGGSSQVSNRGILGRYEFDGNLKDLMGKLDDGYSTIGRVLYTTDRKGQANSAIRFNTAYGVEILDVPASSTMSLSLWVKQDIFPNYWAQIISSWKSFTLQQYFSKYNCSYWNGINQQDVELEPIDNNWHHIAATRDNSIFKFYFDGVLIGSSPTPAGAGPYFPLNNFLLGFGGGTYWNGSLDDLRFYARVLSTSEVNILANM